MIENFIFSANAVIPIFVVVAFGYFLKLRGHISVKVADEMNKLVFSFALPFLLFRNIYQADFVSLFDGRFILWILGSITIGFLSLWIFAEVFLRNRQELIGAFVQAGARPNFAIVGIPLAANILGDADTGKAALAAAFIVIANNIMSVIVLTAKNTEVKGFDAFLFKNTIVGICKNPSVIGIVLAIALNLLNLPIPFIIWQGVNSIAILCTPMALIAVGASIKIPEIMATLKPALVASTFKTVILPLLFVTISAALGFYGESLIVLFLAFASPTAIVSYTMAANMNGSTAITSSIILITTVFSSVTLTIGVYILRTLALI